MYKEKTEPAKYSPVENKTNLKSNPPPIEVDGLSSVKLILERAIFEAQKISTGSQEYFKTLAYLTQSYTSLSNSIMQREEVDRIVEVKVLGLHNEFTEDLNGFMKFVTQKFGEDKAMGLQAEYRKFMDKMTTRVVSIKTDVIKQINKITHLKVRDTSSFDNKATIEAIKYIVDRLPQDNRNQLFKHLKKDYSEHF